MQILKSKQVSNETKLVKWIILLPVIGVLLTSFILTNIFISSKKESYTLEINNLQVTHISNLKNTIQERINHVSLLLDNNYQQQINESKKTIREITNIGYVLLERIYQNNQHLNKKDLYKKIDEEMKNISFFKNNIGYFFIYDLKDGTSISLPSSPHLVGTSLIKLEDVNGKNLFQSFSKILNKRNEGFDEWYWNKPNEQKKVKKIGFIKKFEPLNIAFGTTIYEEDITAEIKKNVIDFLKSLAYKDNSYIFVMDTFGTAIIHKNESIIDVKIEKLNRKIHKNVKNIIKKALSTNGSFLEYDQSKKLFDNFNQSKKISYVKHIPKLDWIIGTGLYTNDLNKQIESKHKLLEKKLEDDIKTVLIVSLFVTFIIVILLLIISNKIRNIFHFYASQLDIKNKRLQNLNNTLEKKVEIEVKQNRDKDKILYQQSKMAAMGEMLGNIAHQWRQPLSSISTAASGISIQNQYGQLTDEHMNHSLAAIVKNTQLLSQTIDDFRNFYKTDKKENTFTLESVIKKVLILIEANLKNKDITIIENIAPLEIHCLENELVQSILNIINNARDALIDLSAEEKKYIFIDIYQKKDQIIINIKDNAGGINEEILNQVFEPYFTTKHKNQGTGIGLYMTHEIITKHLNGSIEASNNVYSYQAHEYTGALFTISLPITK